MHYIRERAAPARKSPVCRLNTRYLPLNIPIKFHWPSPSFPLAIPIFSTDHPHLFHWPSPSFPLAILICSEQRWPTGARKNKAICSIFSRGLIVASISRQRRQDGAATGHTHLFHWPPPSLPLSVPIFSTGRPRILRSPGEIWVTNVCVTCPLLST